LKVAQLAIYEKAIEVSRLDVLWDKIRGDMNREDARQN
jgi:hypothetical protein